MISKAPILDRNEIASIINNWHYGVVKSENNLAEHTAIIQRDADHQYYLKQFARELGIIPVSETWRFVQVLKQALLKEAGEDKE